MKKHIPNFITSINLFSGSAAILFLLAGEPVVAVAFIAVGMLADFFDGMTARLLNVKSELGVQLDSLADLISFGLFPGLVLFLTIESSVNAPFFPLGKFNAFSFVALLVPVFSAIRLGRFNLDTRQTETFIGLPTPANALLIMSICLFPLISNEQRLFDVLMLNMVGDYWFLLLLTLASCWLMNSEAGFFSLKVKSFKWKDNALRYGFGILTVGLIVLMQWRGFAAVMMLYVLVNSLVYFAKRIRAYV